MSDLDYRKNSIPYLAQIFGYNRNEMSDQDITNARALGDLTNLANGMFLPLKDNYIRILRPSRSEIVSAYLSLSLKMSASEPNSSFKVSITKVTSNTDLSVVALTAAEIASKHRTIRGNDQPFSNTAGQLISAFKLDLAPLIPKYGNPDFRKDCYVVGIHFPTQPVSSGFKLYKFEINGSALIVR